MLGACLTLAARSAEIVWQPVTDYSISFPGDRADAAPAINPFDNFTHFGTDFGWMGPGQGRLDARAGTIRTKPDGEWTGAWHSLAGLATETQRVFDPTDLTGLGGPAEVRAGVVAVTVDARGQGELRVALADASKGVRWARTMALVPGEKTRHRFEVDAVGQVLERLAAFREETQLDRGQREFLAQIGIGLAQLAADAGKGGVHGQTGFGADDEQVERVGG